MDVHSYARPSEARVTSVVLDLRADFDARRLVGSATLTIERAPGARSLVLDTRGLVIHSASDASGRRLAHALGGSDSVLGRPLEIDLPAEGHEVVVSYETSVDAAALQWLSPEQTAGGSDPFLYSQGQAILTRTWIPTQDSPGIRQTYRARIVVPPQLRAVMSAESLSGDGVETPEGRVFEFSLAHPVPPYLFALAVGRLDFRTLGPRSGVYAEPATIEAAAFEFADVERMIDAAESLLGPYRWGRYDLLVLPPSFPFGGMENPLLTFATPTILAGDRSLVGLVAHELAHSWSGNLVTNATWSDFWLNEGVTTYVESRIMEALNGTEHAAMLAVLARQELLEEIERLGGASSRDTVLHLDLHGRDPDDGATRIPYEKGAALMTLLERTVGRTRFDAFLRSYFDRFAFQSIDTNTFLGYLQRELPIAEQMNSEPRTSNTNIEPRTQKRNPEHEPQTRTRNPEPGTWNRSLLHWIFEPGLPENAVQPHSKLLDRVTGQARTFLAGASARSMSTQSWTTQEWLHFLNQLPERLSDAQLSDLDDTFGLSNRGNSEVLFLWLRIAIRHHYQPAMPALERFLSGQGRRKFLRPLYEDLMATVWGRPEARRIYRGARSRYHAVATATLDGIVN